MYSSFTASVSSGIQFGVTWTALSPAHQPGFLTNLCKHYFSTSSVLANVRDHFPRPNERRRINRHGWNKRMATVAGRRILMRRILKGRHVLSH
ncbi:hypothetical protein B566_EDAN012056 [Ephemera danica]|nr:hypothetical protein B566_EDAN012056 [Ephemera danica]